MVRWLFLAFLSSCGGQGKTLAAELFTLFLQATGQDVQVFSADVQQKLSSKVGGQVITIDTDLLDEAAEDPLVTLRAFAPLSQAVARSAKNGSSILLDTAATWDTATIRYLHDMRFDRLVADAGGELVLVLVTTANPDAIRAMVSSTEKIRETLPSARVVWILNEHFGPVTFNAGLLGLRPAQLAEMRATVTEVVFPRMNDLLWQPVDRAGMNMVDFVAADPATLAGFWLDGAGNSLDDPATLRVVQRRIAAWIGGLMEAAAQVARFPAA